MDIIHGKLGFDSKDERDDFLRQNPNCGRRCRICLTEVLLVKMIKSNNWKHSRYFIGFRCRDCKKNKKKVGILQQALIPDKFRSKEGREAWAKKSRKLFACRNCKEKKQARFFKRHTCINKKTGERSFMFDSGCRACETKASACRQTVSTSNLAGTMQARASSIKNRCSKSGISYDLDGVFLKSLWEKQQGRCFYTEMPMEWHPKGTNDKGKFSFSVDRIDASKGYTKDNVVLCTKHVNTMKSNLNLDVFWELILALFFNRNKWCSKLVDQMNG